MKRWRKNILALFVGCFIALCLFEIFLQIYNPFRMRVSGNEIELPANQKYEFNNVKIAGLDSYIVHTKNSLGFRGPELGDEKLPRIFCVGGSTTECFYLNDGDDWPAIFGRKLGDSVWLNNAGLDGHSTRGHIILLRDHLLKYKPTKIYFLVGCNDVAAQDLNTYESGLMKSNKRFLQHFETYNLLSNLRLAAKARKRGMGHTGIDFAKYPKADTSGWRNEKADTNLLLAYKKRIEVLINICLENKITPVFITQPTLLSDTGYNGHFEFQGKSGLHYWNVLRAYNSMLIQTCLDHKVRSLDLASRMPTMRDCYYDFFHFTNFGASEVAERLFLLEKGPRKYKID